MHVVDNARTAPDNRWQVRQRRVLEVGVDLLDDRVPTVGLARGDGVEDRGVGGDEEPVEPPGVEQGVLAGCFVLLGVEVRDPADHEPAEHVVGLLLRGERGERRFSDLGT
jgi:hypothetical protein